MYEVYCKEYIIFINLYLDWLDYVTNQRDIRIIFLKLFDKYLFNFWLLQN